MQIRKTLVSLMTATALTAGAITLPLSAEKNTSPGIEAKIPYEKFTLDNGLRVIVHEDHKAPIVAVGVWYHVGSKDEPEGRTGFAHLFEHLMFNGSENYNDEYFKPFEAVGATGMNGTTWFDRTNYFENVPTPALEMALWMESDRMGHLLGAVTQERLDEQRGVVQNEKRQGDNQPYGTVQYRQLEGLFPPGHPYRHSTIGSLEDLDAASLDDVKSWFKEYYGSANTVLVLAGDVTVEKAKELAQKYFGDIAAGPALRHHKSWVPTRTENTVEEMVDQSAPQVRIYRDWAVAPRTSKDAQQLRLTADILGGGKNSRLYQALVYKNQLASNVNVSIQQFELASMFEIDVTLKDGSDPAEVERLINQEMDKFLAEGPSIEEIKRSKTKISARTVRGLEQIGGFGGKATALAQGELYAGDPGFAEKSLNWMNAATTDDVQAVSNEWLGKGYYQLTVKPYGKYQVAESTVDRSKLPEIGELPGLTFPEIQEATLKNGMKVVLANRTTVPIVNMALQFDAGYAADFGRAPGTASLTLDMLDEGTKKRSALEIAAEAEGLGATINTTSNLDMSQIRMSALKTNLKDSLDLFADVVRNPAFDEGEFARQKQLRLARIQQEKAQPIGLALRNLPPLIYGADHAYGAPFTGTGTVEAVNAMTTSDLSKFHSDWLRPDNATLFIVGDVTLDEAVPALEKAFGNWKAPASAIPQKNIDTVSLPDNARVVIMDKPGSPQSFILAGHLFPSTGSADNLALTAANDIIGGAFTARVNMNLREDKGWSYGASTIKLDARGQAMWITFAPVQTDKTKESIMELQKEFAGYLGITPARQDELDNSRNNNTNSLPGQFETSNAVLGNLLSNQRFGRSNDYVVKLKGRYDALDLPAVHKAAQDYMHPDQMTWLIVGDRSKIEAGIREIGFDNIEVWDANGNRLD
ncbi:pitrilysin family protein [Kordiimonas sp. SCSIO 12610]|uniref:M16 family metallopeptidase n=1 Tax=Kordiimonas sp. SCSIO 12610 TaxID=2829597 RepID=UPI00210D1CE9|nr:pitrilysin family protein [Kordiimonas sp. SCSIO 12610]UTW55784.1 insulinase family protein [Kordiimonas sp. SCSIO 12610]